MKERRAWFIWSGRMYTGGGGDNRAFLYKKDAIAWIKSQGHKYNSEQGLWLNETDLDEFGLGSWIVLEEGVLHG